VSSRALFRGVAIAEACTWAGLLAGMWFKYVPETTELGVQVFGPLHGIAFIAYCLTTVVVAVDQRWRAGRTVVGLLCAIPPFATLAFEWYVERRGGLADHWRLTADEPAGPLERLVCWLIRRPGQGLAAGVAAVAVLTAVALVAGPPVG
jgi:integral membrane protein